MIASGTPHFLPSALKMVIVSFARSKASSGSALSFVVASMMRLSTGLSTLWFTANGLIGVFSTELSSRRTLSHSAAVTSGRSALARSKPTM